MAENWMYILAESEHDQNFYNLCVEKMTGQTFRLIPRALLRKGAGADSVKRSIRWLANDIKHAGAVEKTCFLIALDNDRHAPHPTHEPIADAHKLPKNEQERMKRCRFCDIENVLHETLDKNNADWPIQGAIAVPVQLLESWLLLMCDQGKYQHESRLPLFAERSQPLARCYYAPGTPPDQLKDCKAKEKAALGLESDDDFVIHCLEKLIPEQLVAISPSFALFKEQVASWQLSQNGEHDLC